MVAIDLLDKGAMMIGRARLATEVWECKSFVALRIFNQIIPGTPKTFCAQQNKMEARVKEGGEGPLYAVVQVLKLLIADVEKSSCDRYLLTELNKLLDQLGEVANEEKKIAPSKALPSITRAVKEAKALLG